MLQELDHCKCRSPAAGSSWSGRPEGLSTRWAQKKEQTIRPSLPVPLRRLATPLLVVAAHCLSPGAMYPSCDRTIAPRHLFVARGLVVSKLTDNDQGQSGLIKILPVGQVVVLLHIMGTRN